MKKFLLAICTLISVVHCSAQDVDGRFLTKDKLIDFKVFYVKNATPGFTNENFNYQLTYIKNFELIGDGIKDPLIGLSLNPSIGYAMFMPKKELVKYTILQDGLLNFTPALYLKAPASKDSKFSLFATTGGGVRFYPRLSKLSIDDSPRYIHSDSNLGLFDQWVFDIGAVIDYDKRFSVFFKYGKAWHDVTSSTKEYYQKYINPESTTFMRYFSVKANYKLWPKTDAPFLRGSAFVEWTGFYKSFDDQRMIKAGLALTIDPAIKLKLGKGRGENSSTVKNNGETQNGGNGSTGPTNSTNGTATPPKDNSFEEDKNRQLALLRESKESAKLILPITGYSSSEMDDEILHVSAINDQKTLDEWKPKTSVGRTYNAIKLIQTSAVKGLQERIKAPGPFFYSEKKFYSPLIADLRIRVDSTPKVVDFPYVIKSHDSFSTLNDRMMSTLKYRVVHAVTIDSLWDQSTNKKIQRISGISYDVNTNTMLLVDDKVSNLYAVGYNAPIHALDDQNKSAAIPVREPESIRVVDAKNIWVSNEVTNAAGVVTESSIVHLKKGNKGWVKDDVIKLPSLFAVNNFQKNSGIEAIALSPNKDFLWAVNERPLKNAKAGWLTILKIPTDRTKRTNNITSIEYELTDNPGFNTGVTDMIQHNDHLFVLERGFNPETCESQFRLFMISTNDSKISKYRKRLVFDSRDIDPKLVDNFEAMTLVSIADENYILLASDNNAGRAPLPACKGKKQKTVFVTLRLKS